jgi:hypothetical protein
MVQKVTYEKKESENKTMKIDYDWEHTKNFFIWTDRIWGRKYFANITRDGNVSLVPLKGKDSYNKFLELWQLWSVSTRKMQRIKDFEYTIWGLIKEYSVFHRLCMLVVAGMSLCVSILLLYPLISTSSMINFLPKARLVLGIMLLISVLLVLVFMRYPRRFHMISPIGDFLKVSFVDGGTEELPLQSIRRYAFDINAYSAFIVFSDGTKLIHLERVSYWPILREYLLSKLEPSGKTND